MFNLSDAGLDALMVSQIAKYGKMPDLTITVKPNTLPFQTKRKLMIQKKLQAPLEAKVAKMIESGGRREVEYSPELWIYDLNAIQKLPGRIDSSTGLLAIRPIGILCAINAAHNYIAHLVEEMPSIMIQEAKQHMPVTSEYMISSYASDRYDVCVIEKNSRKYVCLWY